MSTTAFLGVAHIHTPGFVKRVNQRADVRCKAVYDHDAERAERRAAELGANVAGLDAILADAEIDSVVICSETNRHLELVEHAAAAGKHMFVEKPLAANAADAARMRRAVERAGVVFQTGFFMRSSPAMQFLKQEAEAGHLGTITRMRHSNCHEGALGGWFDAEWSWIADAAQAGGGGFADLGAHALDIVLWVMRPLCGPVRSACARLGSATHRYGEIDEYGAGIVTFESGALAVVEASWVDPKLRSPVELFGTEGQLQVTDGKVYYWSKHVDGADGGEWTNLPAQKPHAFELFWDRLAGQDAPLVTVEEAAEESRVMAEMYRAQA